MGEATKPAAGGPGRRRSRARPPVATNVVPLYQRILPRHAELLARWLQAGRPMGLCDASACPSERSTATATQATSEYVLVWVRENIDPAYVIRPERFEWVVVDALRDHELGRTRSFAAALNLIRPVLGIEEAA